MKTLKIAVVFLVLLLCAQFFSESLKEKRDALISGNPSIAELQKVISTESDLILRLTAVRIIGEKGDAVASAFLQELVRDKEAEPQIRMNALLALWKSPEKNIDEALLGEVLHSEDESLRYVATTILFSEKPLSDARVKLADDMLKNEKNQQIINLIANASWNFHRNVPLLKDRPEWDHEAMLVAEYPLPLEDWAFAKDDQGNLHLMEKCYEKDYDDSGWQRLPIGKTWEECGVQHDGIAWYRKSFQAPEMPADFNAAELHFDGVDESAWVWLNGEYVGVRDIGSIGWDIPFSLDVTDLIHWGEINQITVRVLDRAYAGGIYKPVQLQIMK